MTTEVRKAIVSVYLDESEHPLTLHEVARIILTCDDAPLQRENIKKQS